MTSGRRSDGPASPALASLPAPLRALFTVFLLTIGIGYLAALFYLFTIDVDPHRQMGMGLVQGIEMKYGGDPGGSRLEAALRGSMAERASATDREGIVAWVRAGAPADGYTEVRPVLESNCMPCHSGGVASIPSLANYDAVAQLARTDRGPSLSQLARVSHVHLFGIGIIFLLTGTIFGLSSVPLTVRVLVLVVPFVAIWLDIVSWWLTRLVPGFAYVVVVGGALMGAALAVQILGSLWALWLVRPATTKSLAAGSDAGDET